MLCGSHIKIWNLANHMKKQNKKHLLMKNWKLRVWCFLFHFFMRFAWFQILICEPQSIWRKLLALSWLYFVNGLGYSNFHFKFWFKIKPLNLLPSSFYLHFRKKICAYVKYRKSIFFISAIGIQWFKFASTILTMYKYKHLGTY